MPDMERYRKDLSAVKMLKQSNVALANIDLVEFVVDLEHYITQWKAEHDKRVELEQTCLKWLRMWEGQKTTIEAQKAEIARFREALEEIMARCEPMMAEDDTSFENYHEAKQALLKERGNGEASNCK